MPGTFSQDYPEDYEYFRDRLERTLSSQEITPELRGIVSAALADLASRIVTKKCECGCKTFDFEHRGDNGVKAYVDLSGFPEIILFHNDDREMTSLEQYPQH